MLTQQCRRWKYYGFFIALRGRYQFFRSLKIIKQKSEKTMGQILNIYFPIIMYRYSNQHPMAILTSEDSALHLFSHPTSNETITYRTTRAKNNLEPSIFSNTITWSYKFLSVTRSYFSYNQHNMHYYLFIIVCIMNYVYHSSIVFLI